MSPRLLIKLIRIQRVHSICCPSFHVFGKIAMRQKKSVTALHLVVAGLLSSVAVATLAMGKAPVASDEEGIASRIQPVGRVEFAAAAGKTGGAVRSGEDVYKAACAACHQSGAAGAPKVGDSADWGPRIKLGLDGLVKSAIAGKNAMPPKGGSDASDLELARAIAYMTNKSGASFKEPAAPK